MTSTNAGADFVLPDVIGTSLHVLFCGSAAGRRSAELHAYYAGPGNRFWPTLHHTGLTPGELDPRDFRRVLEFRIGLTDIVKKGSGPDRELSPQDQDPEHLSLLLARYRPRLLAFNGKRAAQVFLGGQVEYGRQPDPVHGSTVHVLPSTSGAARRWWDESYWFELAAEVRSG